MTDASASVVVPTWQRATYLRGCLEGVLDQVPAPGEVLVVGRDGDVEAFDLVRSFSSRQAPPVRWLTVDVPGHLPPIRKGLEAASSDVVVFLDDDAVPQAGWLNELLVGLRSPRVACVGGRYVSGTPAVDDRRGEARNAGRLRWYGRFFGAFDDLGPRRLSPADGVFEGNSAWRTEILRGLVFEPSFEAGDSLHYGMDLCQQARAHGFAVLYAHRARALHHWAERAPDAVARDDRIARCYYHGRNFTLIALRHFRGIRRTVFPFWWLLIGERQCYGLLTGTIDLLKDRKDVWPLIVASFKGREAGWKLWRRARRSRFVRSDAAWRESSRS